jgi:acyl-CoA synthetase (AMP-forming)/AMP-acid ligase II
MTTVVPEIDPSRPATVDPEKIVRAIQQEKITNSFGSPTLWRIIASHCLKHGLTLPSLKRVLMAGAPVPPSLFADLQKILPNGTAYSPYGATESLPVASISAREVLEQTAALTATGAGTCVGRPVKEIEIKIIAISDARIVSLSDTHELPTGEIGEIIVRGPVVTKAYDALPDATAAAKISASRLSPLASLPGGAAAPWHRMGDLGYLDPEGRLWFCGRKAERVETREGPLYTEQVEPIYNAHPAVARSALIATGHDGHRPAIVIEPVSREVVATPSLRRKLVRELRELSALHSHTDRIRLTYLHPHFPVDVRHNAKIHRLKLAAWAVGKHGYESDKRTIPRDILQQ